MRIFSALFFSLFFSWTIFSQELNVEWMNAMGGSGADWAQDIEHTRDGGFVIVGWTTSRDGDVGENYGSYDIWLVKIDPFGHIDWEQNYGGSQQDRAYSVLQTEDGGYIILGDSNSSDGDVPDNKGRSDVYIIKTTSSGAIDWQRTYGGSGFDFGHSIITTEDNGYLVVGTTQSDDGDVQQNYGSRDVWVLKLNAFGILQWEQNYGGSGIDQGTRAIQLPDETYAILGHTNSEDGDVTQPKGEFDSWLLNIGTAGQIIWQKTYGNEFANWGEDLLLAEDDNIVFVGQSFFGSTDYDNNKKGFDISITKVDLAGDILWENFIDRTVGDDAREIVSHNEGFFVVGDVNLEPDADRGNFNLAGFELDSEGNVTCEGVYGGSDLDFGFAVTEVTDGGYVLAGITESSDGDVQDYNGGDSDFWLVKVNGCRNLANANPLIIPIIPNAFTPDNDGTNDFFEILWADIIPESSHLSLFNRWGEQVFESFDHFTFWNGYSRGQKSPQGIYIYQLDFIYKGLSYSRKGDVILIR